MKESPSADHAHSELLANKLYETALVKVPEMQLVTINGNAGVASKFIDGARIVGTEQLANLKGVHEGFAADAWLANWDVVGLHNDNLLMVGDEALRIDTGGALKYRARGEEKGAAFSGKRVDELDNLRDFSLNPSAAEVFGAISDETIIDSAKNVLAISDETICALCNEWAGGDGESKKAIAQTLIERKNVLAGIEQLLNRQQVKDALETPYQQRLLLDLQSKFGEKEIAKMIREVEGDHWSNAESAAVGLYMRGKLYQANADLRKGKTSIRQDGELIMYGLHSAFQKNQTSEAVKKTFRGGHVPPEAVEGGVISDLGYMSTSANVNVAKQFAGRDDASVMQTVFGQSGLPISGDYFSNEKEYLYNRHTRFDVLFDARQLSGAKAIVLAESRLSSDEGRKYQMDLAQTPRHLMMAVETPTVSNKQNFDQRVIINTDTNDTAVNKAVQNLANKHPDNSVIIAPTGNGGHKVLQGTLTNGGNAKVEVVGHSDGTTLGGLDANQIGDVVRNLELGTNTKADKLALVGCGTACAKDGNSLVSDVSSQLLRGGNSTQVKGYKGRVDVDVQGHKYAPEEGGLMRLANDVPLNKDLLRKRVRAAKRGNATTENVQPSTQTKVDQGEVKVLYGDSFQKVADKYQTVIGLRAPNPLGASLLSEGFPSKNFHVKAKSSPTGPTAGFIAESPVYSKVDPKKHGAQQNYIAESVKKGAELVPLNLSTQRIAELLSSGDMKSLGDGLYAAEYPAGTQHFSISKDGAVSTPDGKPVRVLTNPPEVGATSHHPLPITADYDLFSLSPKASQDYNLTPFKVGSRFAYGKWGEKNLPLFTSSSKKGASEDPNMGNVSEYTRTIVRSLNKEASSEGYKGGPLVWHGDEANNPFSPGFDPNDQPVFFVPGKKPVRVTSKQELLKFEETLKQEGYTPGTSNRF